MKLRGFLLRLLPWIAFAMLCIAFVISWKKGGIAYEMIRADLTGEQRVASLKRFMDQAGSLGPLVYVAFVTVEVVVAPIPGLFLYAPGGLIFGKLAGGVLAIIGNVLGAGIACGLARGVGDRWLRRIVSIERVESLQKGLESRGFWLIVLLRLNPVTSNDLVSYAVGFTRIPVAHVMLATGIGMTPLCLAQSWISDSVFHRWPALLWPMVGLGVIYVFVVLMILARLLRGSVKAEAGTTPIGATANAESMRP